MVLSRDHGAHTVRARWKATLDRSLKEPFAVSRIVNTFEECKLGRIWRSLRRERADVLNSDMAMANDVSVAVEILRRSIVIGRRVDKVASL